MKATTRVALVAMPWSQVDRPSAAISALSAYVRQECRDVDVVCFPAYVDVAAAIGFDTYDVVAQYAYRLGEPIYGALLYPTQREAVTSHIADTLTRKNSAVAGVDWRAVLPGMYASLEEHIQQLARALSSYDVIGLTTCFGQLFANVHLARAIKTLNPGATIVMGGSTVSATVGPSLLREYAAIDFVIQGEGERPLVTLLRALADGTEPAPETGVLSRRFAAEGRQATLSEVGDMNALPLPDYDAYAELAARHDIAWALPIEGSRGCWWDRTKRKGNPRATCYFCNLNVQWGGYREKAVDRLVDETTALSTKYQKTKLYFVDNIMRTTGAEQLAQRIEESGRQFEIFYEMRANIKPFELVRLWEAGLATTQFGVESLSSSVLKKMGKGTTVIDNLQAMKLCAELGIGNGANLIINFPGTTSAEVEETRRNILLYALPYEPMQVSTFSLGLESTVAVLANEFGITNVRNSEDYRAAVPDEVWSRIQLFELDYDAPADSADWTPVVETCRQWRGLRERSAPPRLYYRDGVAFMQIISETERGRRELRLSSVERDVYLFCCNIRSWNQIVRKHEDVPERVISEILCRFIENRVMYSDGERFLSLATAPRAIDAARRIRQAHFDETAAAPTRAVGRLPVVA